MKRKTEKSIYIYIRQCSGFNYVFSFAVFRYHSLIYATVSKNGIHKLSLKNCFRYDQIRLTKTKCIIAIFNLSKNLYGLNFQHLLILVIEIRNVRLNLLIFTMHRQFQSNFASKIFLWQIFDAEIMTTSHQLILK